MLFINLILDHKSLLGRIALAQAKRTELNAENGYSGTESLEKNVTLLLILLTELSPKKVISLHFLILFTPTKKKILTGRHDLNPFSIFSLQQKVNSIHFTPRKYF
jgi:hypothetical protein